MSLPTLLGGLLAKDGAWICKGVESDKGVGGALSMFSLSLPLCSPPQPSLLLFPVPSTSSTTDDSTVIGSIDRDN